MDEIVNKAHASLVVCALFFYKMQKMLKYEI